MTVPSADARTRAPAPPQGCVHHWLLDRPAASGVRGVCRGCGAARVFTNEPLWNRRPPGPLGGRGLSRNARRRRAR